MIMGWGNERAVIIERDDGVAARLRDLVVAALGPDAVVERIAEAADALDLDASDPPVGVALVAVSNDDHDGREAIAHLAVNRGIPVVATAPRDDIELWRAAAECGAPVGVATDDLDADHLSAMLSFAAEAARSRRVERLLAANATAILSAPGGDETSAVIDRLRAELDVDAIELVIRPNGIDDDLAVVTTVGTAGPSAVPKVVTQVAPELTVALTVHASAQRRLDCVEPALARLGALLLAGIEVEQVRRRTRSADDSRYRSLAEHSPDPVLSVSATGIVTLANPSFRHAAGLDDLTGHSLAELATRAEIAGFASRAFEQARRSGQEEHLDDQLIRRADGSVSYYAGRAVPETTGAASAVHVILHETTSRVEQQRRLAELTLTDPLTGVANRRLGFDRLAHALARRSRHGGMVATCVIDIDHFKSINDLLGHDGGDEVVRIFSRRLQQAVRGADTVARLGADDFLVLLEIPDDSAEVGPVVERLHAEVKGPVTLDGHSLEVNTSLGYAVADEDPITAAELVTQADRALNDAKRGGRGIVVRYDGRGSLFGSAAEMQIQLRRAVDEDRFALRYQPITDSQGRTVATEGLLRWDHPEFGLLSPGDFIEPLLEGPLAVPMGRWVVTAALEQLHRWRHEGAVGNDFTMHVNVAPQQLPDIGLIDHIVTEIDRLGLGAGHLAVEVTEQSLFELDRSLSSLHRLRDAGVILLLDDFGTGASSLTNLRSSVLAGIKIDRSFVAGIEHGGRDTAIVEGLLELGSNSGLSVVAEGIERDGQRDWFERYPETRLQGFLFGRPQDADALAAQLIG